MYHSGPLPMCDLCRDTSLPSHSNFLPTEGPACLLLVVTAIPNHLCGKSYNRIVDHSWSSGALLHEKPN